MPLPPEVFRYPLGWIRVDNVVGCQLAADGVTWLQPLPFAHISLEVRLTLTNQSLPTPNGDGSVQFPKLAWYMVRGDGPAPNIREELWNQDGNSPWLARGSSLKVALMVSPLAAASHATRDLPAFMSLQFMSATNKRLNPNGPESALGPPRVIHFVTGVNKTTIPKVGP